MTDVQFSDWLSERGADDMAKVARKRGIEAVITAAREQRIYYICSLLVQDGAITLGEITKYRNFRLKLIRLIRDLELIGDDDYQPSKPFNPTGGKGKPEWGLGWRK